jgi:hypothetical protein
MASCRSCNADIEWAEWADTGKAVPLDVGAKPNGNLVVVSGKVRRYTHEDAKLGREKRASHFATCPDAKDWRSR